MNTAPRYLAPILLSVVLVGCGARIAEPDDTVTAWVDAIQDGRCEAAGRLLDPGARGGLEPQAWAEWCSLHLGSLQEQAANVRASLDDGAMTVRASVPLDIARDASLVHTGTRWALSEQPPLLGGGDDPVDALESLAAVLSSDGMQDVLAVLSEDAREQYGAEIRAVVEALLHGRDARVRVTGDAATIDVGTMTVRLVREAGAWRVDEVEQSGYGGGLGYFE